MQVVAAGVHHAVHLAAVGDVELLLHGQGVHVGAQQHHRPLARVGAGTAAPRPAAASQDRGDAGRGVTGGDLQVEPGQRLQDRLLGPGQVQTDLRVAVQRVAQAHQVVGQGEGVVCDGHRTSLGW